MATRRGENQSKLLKDLLSVAPPYAAQTLTEVAERNGRKKNGPFGLDMAAVRHQALRLGHCITHSGYDHFTKNWPFYVLLKGERVPENDWVMPGWTAQFFRHRRAIWNLIHEGDWAAENAWTENYREATRRVTVVLTRHAEELSVVVAEINREFDLKWPVIMDPWLTDPDAE